MKTTDAGISRQAVRVAIERAKQGMRLRKTWGKGWLPSLPAMPDPNPLPDVDR